MRKILCVVCILLISFVTTFTYAENENSSIETENTTVSTDLQTQRDLLKQQLDQATVDLSTIQTDLSENLQQIQKLDDKISSAEQELSEQESKIEELKKTINDVEEQLDTVTEKYNKQKDLFEQRIVALYEAGEIQYLDVLVKSTSLTDFISTYYQISEIAQSDEELLEDIEQKRKTIDLSKRKLENEKNSLADILETQTRLTRTLQNTKVIRESFITRLSEEEQAKQKEIDDYNVQYEEVNRQIIASVMEGINTEYIGGELAWPVPGYTRITSEYKMRVHPITGVYKLHTGVDISAPMGANFIAANDGVVIKAEMNGAYGNMVVIDHGGGISTLYAHGSEILVHVGQTVKRGEAVLKVGSTGYSTGAHAHFEVRINGVTTNPLPYITTGLIPNADNTVNENKTD